MKRTYKLVPLYIFIGIISGFSFLISFFWCMGTSEEDMMAIVLFFAAVCSSIGILFLSLENQRQLPK